MRLCFSMARDDQLPGSSALKTVSPRLHTPWVACIVVTWIAAIPLLQYAGATYLAIAATGMRHKHAATAEAVPVVML
jgi:amino acid transporter